MAPYPIIVMSFNRPQYLREVLNSLKAQDRDISSAPIVLFQDAAVNAHSGRRHAADEDIEESVRVFREIFPRGEVRLAENNLGVCENFLRAEKYAFEEVKADVAYFFEDDMVLSPHYLSVMDSLAQFALSNGRVGYFSAHGNHKLTLEQQLKAARRIVRLGHHWAFGLTRHHWLELHKWLTPYYKVVVGKDYRDRPTKEILKAFRSHGIPVGVSSQDDMKKVGTYMLKRASISTVTCHAKYIGESGLHMNKQKFEDHGYAKTAMFPICTTEFDFPNNEQVDQMIADELKVRRANIEAAAAKEAEALANAPVKPATAAAVAVKAAAPAPAKAAINGSGSSVAAKLMQDLFGEDIYKDPAHVYPKDMQGWNSKHPIFKKLILEKRPSIILDVGVWKGLSTIHMANILKTEGIDGCIVGIDTFLGAPEHWNQTRDIVYASLKFVNGFPHLYYQFLSNVIAAGMQDYVVPFPQTSENAAVILKKLKIAPQLIHIDAAHEYEPVMRDIKMYWDLLAPGGLLVGDDFSWHGVKQAATEFAEANHLELTVDHPKWLLRKP